MSNKKFIIARIIRDLILIDFEKCQMREYSIRERKRCVHLRKLCIHAALLSPLWKFAHAVHYMLPCRRSSRVNLYDAFLRHFGRSIISIHLQEKGRRALHICASDASVCAVGMRRALMYLGETWPHVCGARRSRRRMRQLGQYYVRSALKCLPGSLAAGTRQFKPRIIPL